MKKLKSTPVKSEFVAPQTQVLHMTQTQVTWKEFLALIPKKETPCNPYSFTKVLSSPFPGFPDSPPQDLSDIYPSNFSKGLIMLRPKSNKSLLADLYSQATLKTLYEEDFESMVSDALISHVEDLGVGEYLVHLADRIWMVADPSDFTLVENGGLAALLVLHPYRCKIVKTHETTLASLLASMVATFPLVPPAEIIKNLKSGRL